MSLLTRLRFLVYSYAASTMALSECRQLGYNSVGEPGRAVSSANGRLCNFAFLTPINPLGRKI
jgi:hypothetical protein